MSSHTTASAEADSVPSVRSLTPFQVSFPQSSIDTLQSRLREATYPPELLPSDKPDAQTTPKPEWLRKVVEQFWLNEKEFSVERMCDELNRFDHYIAEIDWCKLHFVHKRSVRKDAIPIILIHGWPGTFHEFLHVIDDLTSPSDPSDPAFHVVIPSLPGYLFSSAPPTREHLIGDVDGYCRIMNALMIGLGYGGEPASQTCAACIPALQASSPSASAWEGYAAQGGDWGSAHARVLSNIKGSRVRAVHLNFCPARPTGWVNGSFYQAFMSVPMSVKQLLATYVVGPEAQEALRRATNFQASMAYYHVQHWRPAQLMAGLTDSPLGLLGWIGHFLQGRLPPLTPGTSKTLTVHSLLTTVALFWLTRSIGTSFLPYTVNTYLPDIVIDPQQYISVPFGFSEFPREIVTIPASWVAGTGNLVWAAKASDGGHFAALEVPAIFTAHLRSAFRRGGAGAAVAGKGKGKEVEGIKTMEVMKGGLWDVEYKKSRQRL